MTTVTKQREKFKECAKQCRGRGYGEFRECMSECLKGR